MSCVLANASRRTIAAIARSDDRTIGRLHDWMTSRRSKRTDHSRHGSFTETFKNGPDLARDASAGVRLVKRRRPHLDRSGTGHEELDSVPAAYYAARTDDGNLH